MKNHLNDLAQKLMQKGFEHLTEREKNVIQRISQRSYVSRNTNREFEARLTFGQRVADRVAAFGGSWMFIGVFAGVLLAWVLLNSVFLVRSHHAFDPYPYILLNLFLSMLAAIQAPVILMSQNRQAARDRLDAAHDYEVNLKAELDIRSLHEKVDFLRDKQWTELMSLQNEQIRCLNRLLDSPPIENKPS